ncbi:MAG: DUF2029 domain-containing protein [Candidatus Omnitrophica bacterium]|nr:DUF2029 domain-containing protein [Candidatus Omnitrophota bacterium]
MLKKNTKIPDFLFCAMAAGYVFFTFMHTLTRKIIFEPNFCDFKRYYDAARLLGVGNIYQLDIGYHPLFFLIFKLFSFLPQRYAGIIWCIVMISLVFISIKLMSSFIDKRFTPHSSLPTIFVLIFITFSYQPLMEDLVVGQVNIILMLLFSLMAFRFQKNNILSGLCMSIMLLLKLQYGLFLVLFLLRKRYKVIASTIFFYLLWAGIFSVFIGGEIMGLYFKKLFFFIGPQDRFALLAGDEFFLPCIFGVLSRVFYNSNWLSMRVVKIIYIVLSTGLLINTYRYIQIKKVTDELENIYAFIMTALLMLFITPFTECHHLTILLPAFFFLFYDTIEKKGNNDKILYLSAFFLIALKYSLNQFPSFHSGISSLLSMGKFYGLIMLYVLVLRLMKNRQGISGERIEDNNKTRGVL